MLKKFIIIDASSFIYRAFYAFPSIKDKNGNLANALFGFIVLFLKSIQSFNPDFITVVHDVEGPTFRHKEFKDYKANRAKTPDELIQQIPKIKEFVASLNIKSFEKQGFEADDIIGTISTLVTATNNNIEVIILSNDKDSLQLINEKVFVSFPNSGNDNYDIKKVVDRFQGVTPEQFSDFRGLTGDPSDNIPGVAGIGEKTAIKLINEFKNIENLYQAIEKGKTNLNNSIITKLINNKENAFFSKKLSIIKKDVDIDFKLEETLFQYKFEKAKTFVTNLGFKSLINRFPSEKLPLF